MGYGTIDLYFYISPLFHGEEGLAKSILVSEETHRKLMIAKMEMGFRSMDDMLSKLVSEVSKARFLEASNQFRAGLRRKRLSLAEVTASGEAIRIELFRQWFQQKEGHTGH